MSAVIIPGISTDVDATISACQGDNPCEAGWQAAYAYASDRAYQLSIYQALQGIAFGVMQYASADRTADKQYDIADRQMVIAEEEYQRYKDHYVACEDALAAEICALTIPDTAYDTYADRAQRDVTKTFSLQRQKTQRARNKYCVSDLLTDLCRIGKAETLAIVAARDAAYREAEQRRDVLDERRWNRRVTILEHGRSIQTGQVNTYSSASQLAVNALGARQNSLNNLLGTLSGAVGSVLNYTYGPQINSPSTFGIGQGSAFNTHWGSFNGGTVHPERGRWGL